jgi:uncharacterized protein (TIGR04255 family)
MCELSATSRKKGAMTFDEMALARLRFVNDPLRAAVAQIRFPATLSLRDDQVIAEIARRLPDLPELTGPTSQVQVPLGTLGQFALTQHQPARFRDPVGTTIVSISPDSASVECTTYPGWEAFETRIRSTLEAIDDLLPPVITRVGLRYVNELLLPGAETTADWRRLLDDEMVGFIGGERIGGRVRRSLEQVTLDMGEDEVTIRHGFVARRDLPESTPSSLYLFDIDAYTEQPGERSTERVMAVLQRYHQWAWTLFRGSIGDDVVAALGGEPA